MENFYKIRLYIRKCIVKLFNYTFYISTADYLPLQYFINGKCLYSSMLLNRIPPLQ